MLSLHPFVRHVATALIVGALATASVFATPVQVNYRARITTAFGSLAVGDIVDGSFIMDTTAVAVPVDPNGTEYFQMVASETIGSSTATNIATSWGLVAHNRASWAPYDVGSVGIDYQSGAGLTVGGVADVSTNFQFWGPTTLFNGEGLDELPNLSFSQVTQSILVFYQSQTQSSELGDAVLTAWSSAPVGDTVPDEGWTIALLGSGLVGLAALRRRFNRG